MVRNTTATDDLEQIETEFDGLTYECKSCGAVTDAPSVNDLPLFGCPAGELDSHNWVRYEGGEQ